MRGVSLRGFNVLGKRGAEKAFTTEGTEKRSRGREKGGAQPCEVDTTWFVDVVRLVGRRSTR
jgi:hypothetical protein